MERFPFIGLGICIRVFRLWDISPIKEDFKGEEIRNKLSMEAEKGWISSVSSVSDFKGTAERDDIKGEDHCSVIRCVAYE